LVDSHRDFFERMSRVSVSLNAIRSDFNQPSIEERDARWTRLRSEMARRGIDCLLINGHSGRWNDGNNNIRYVVNYADPISAQCFAIFPREGEGTLLTHFQPKRSAYAMSWFEDIRGMQAQRLAANLHERLTDLGIRNGTLGMVDIFVFEHDSIGIPWNYLEDVRRLLPDVKFVDATDMFYEMRSVKSPEEIACLAQSARLVDIGFEAHVELAAEGIEERQLFAGVIRAMDAAGAEPPTTFLLQSGPMPYETLTQDPIPSGRRLEPGDVIISETSPKWGGYQAQGLQCIVLGKATAEMRELARHAAEVWHTCADLIRPGNRVDDVVNAADPLIERARRTKLGGLADSLRPLLAGAGLGGLDPYPVGGIIQRNQAFMLEIGPGGRPYLPAQHVNGGYLIVSTEGAPRHFDGSHPIEDRLLVEV